MIYPQKLNSKDGDIILRISIVTTIVLAVLLFVINKLITPEINWSAIANCGIIYAWITVIYSIKRNTNIAGHVLLQILMISVVMLYIDYRLGFRGWSINIAIPIILIVANAIMLILTILSYKKYINYAIYQLTIVLITICLFIFVGKEIIGFKVLWQVTSIISILNLLVTISLCSKEIKEAIIRKVHR